MLKWSDYLAQEQHYHDLLDEADRERRTRPEPVAVTRPVRVYQSLLAEVGRRLVVWGCRLQLQAGAALAIAQQPPQPITSSPCAPDC